MKLLAAIFTILTCGANCVVACPADTKADVNSGWCIRAEGSVFGNQTEVRVIRQDIWLQQSQLAAQEALLSEIRAMKETIMQLRQAVDNLNAASTQLKASNETWRASTLNETVQRVNAIPASLASNKALVEGVAARLVSDAAWLEEVRGALTR